MGQGGAVEVPRVGEDLVGHAGVDTGGEGLAAGVIGDDLDALHDEALEVDLAFRLEEVAAGEPFEAIPAEDVVLGGVQGASAQQPFADQRLEAADGRFGRRLGLGHFGLPRVMRAIA